MGISKRYNVTVDDKFGKESDGDFSFMADGLAVTGTGFMTTETDDMKQLKKLYKQKREIKDDAAYILKKAKTDDGTVVAGDMPRSHQVGYVFSEDAKYSDAKTIAHELGHGLYSFEHTFENKGAKQGSTDNLMDYNDGVADKMLKVWQWNLLYTHKNYTVPFLEDDEDAMMQENDSPFDKVLSYCYEVYNKESQKGNNIIYCRASLTNQETKNKDSEGYLKSLTTSLDFYYPGILNILSSDQIDLTFSAPNFKDLIKQIEVKNSTFIPINDENRDYFLSSTSCEFIVYKDNNGDFRYCLMLSSVSEELIDQLKENNGFDQLAQHIKNNWPNCSQPENNSNENLNEDQIKSILNSIVQQFRPNQGIEYSANGKNYRLNNEGELVESSLTNNDINNGIFDLEYNEEAELYRFYRNSDGVLQLLAYGINKNTKAFDNKEVDLSALSYGYKEKANQFLKDKYIKSVDQKVEKEESPSLSSKFNEDIYKFKIENASAFKLLSEAGGIGYTFITSGMVEKQVYYSDVTKVPGYKDNRYVYMPSLFTGPVEGVGKYATDITDICGFAYNAIFDSDFRNNQVPKALSDIGSDPNMMTDVLCSTATGLDTNEMSEIVDENTDSGRKNHLCGRIATHVLITTAEFILTGGGTSALRVALKDISKGVAKKSAKTIFLKTGIDVFRESARQAILKDKAKFIKGALIQAATYLFFYHLTKKEDSTFPVADFIDDVLLAGIDNVRNSTLSSTITGCLSGPNQTDFVDALFGEGKFADDYTGNDKKSLSDCLNDAAVDCLIGAVIGGGSSYAINRFTQTGAKVIKNNHPDIPDATSMLTGLTDLMKDGIINSKMLRCWLINSQRYGLELKNSRQCVENLIQIVKEIDIFKDLHLNGFDFNKITTLSKVADLIELTKTKYVTTYMISQLNNASADHLIAMIKCYKRTGGSLDNVVKVFSEDLFSIYKELSEMIRFKDYFPSLKVGEVQIVEELKKISNVKCVEKTKGQFDFTFVNDYFEETVVFSVGVTENASEILKNASEILKKDEVIKIAGDVIVKYVTDNNGKNDNDND